MVTASTSSPDSPAASILPILDSAHAYEHEVRELALLARACRRRDGARQRQSRNELPRGLRRGERAPLRRVPRAAAQAHPSRRWSRIGRAESGVCDQRASWPPQGQRRDLVDLGVRVVGRERQADDALARAAPPPGSRRRRRARCRRAGGGSASGSARPLRCRSARAPLSARHGAAPGRRRGGRHGPSRPRQPAGRRSLPAKAAS